MSAAWTSRSPNGCCRCTSSSKPRRPRLRPTCPARYLGPRLDEGPHFSYAIQWLIFTTIAAVGYPLILRRRAREVAQEELEAALDGPDPDDVVSPDDPRVDAGPARR